MERIDLTGSYTPDVSQSSQNAEALREHLVEQEQEKAAQQAQQNTSVQAANSARFTTANHAVAEQVLSLIHISEPTRLLSIS